MYKERKICILCGREIDKEDYYTLHFFHWTYSVESHEHGYVKMITEKIICKNCLVEIERGKSYNIIDSIKKRKVK